MLRLRITIVKHLNQKPKRYFYTEIELIFGSKISVLQPKKGPIFKIYKIFTYLAAKIVNISTVLCGWSN